MIDEWAYLQNIIDFFPASHFCLSFFWGVQQVLERGFFWADMGRD